MAYGPAERPKTSRPETRQPRSQHGRRGAGSTPPRRTRGQRRCLPEGHGKSRLCRTKTWAPFRAASAMTLCPRGARGGGVRPGGSTPTPPRCPLLPIPRQGGAGRDVGRVPSTPVRRGRAQLQRQAARPSAPASSPLDPDFLTQRCPGRLALFACGGILPAACRHGEQPPLTAWGGVQIHFLDPHKPNPSSTGQQEQTRRTGAGGDGARKDRGESLGACRGQAPGAESSPGNLFPRCWEGRKRRSPPRPGRGRQPAAVPARSAPGQRWGGRTAQAASPGSRGSQEQPQGLALREGRGPGLLCHQGRAGGAFSPSFRGQGWDRSSWDLTAISAAPWHQESAGL